ncbi:hypothetical protein HDU97_008242 [Phlyctochytrium planicorne]|nr:hypothetical protein HDU97_008242 [Phlyctochytrium planicorne]
MQQPIQMQQQPIQTGVAYQPQVIQTAPMMMNNPNDIYSSTISDPFKKTSSIALVLSMVGLIFAGVSTHIEWLAIGVAGKSPDYYYTPYELKNCQNGACISTSMTACQFLSQSGGSSSSSRTTGFEGLCTHDDNVRGLVVSTAVFGAFAIVSTLYCFHMNRAATKRAFQLAAFLNLFACLLAVCSMGECGAIIDLPAFKKGSTRAYATSGYGTQAMTMLCYIAAGGIMLAQSRYAPVVADPVLVAQAKAPFMGFSAPMLPMQPVMYPAQPVVAGGVMYAQQPVMYAQQAQPIVAVQGVYPMQTNLQGAMPVYGQPENKV